MDSGGTPLVHHVSGADCSASLVALDLVRHRRRVGVFDIAAGTRAGRRQLVVAPVLAVTAIIALRGSRGAVARKRLTREVLTATALRIVNSHGLDALSMRRLGLELGVDPMAAYRHIPNKESRSMRVVEAVMTGIETETFDASLPWQHRLRSPARSYLAALMAHPHAARQESDGRC